MKKILGILILTLGLILLNSCAKPTVINIALPEDKESSCKELENGILDAQEFRSKALAVTGNTAAKSSESYAVLASSNDDIS